MFMRWMRAGSCIVLAAFVAGCGAGNGDGLDGNGRPLAEGGGGGGPLTSTFSSIQANVFTPNCAISGCHSGATAPHGLRLDAGSSYALLVGVPSDEVPGLNRVDPGNPDDSYVIQKLEGRAAVGGRMPLNGPPYLPQATIDVIRQWISDGALQDSGTPNVPPTVVSVTPADQAALDSFPAELVVIFSQDMDASLVNESSVLLTASGGDGTFDDDNAVAIAPASVALDPDNARRAIVNLTGVTASADTYELRLTAGNPIAIADVNGLVLDGDGDGEAGGDFVSTFVVAGVQPTLQSIQALVFTPICSTCHTGPAGPELPEGQDLTSVEASFASLVGVSSTEVSTLLRVNPGDPDTSYLVQKLEGTADVGAPMPLGGTPLSAATIAAIRAWIAAGAPFDSSSDDVTPPAVSLDALAPTVSGSVHLSASASDDVGVLSVTFFLGDTPLASDASAPYGLVWDTRTLDNGPYAISAEATDQAGNTARSTTAVNVFNDTTLPTVSLTSPQAGDIVAGVVSLVAAASDDVGVAAVDFLVDGALIDSDSETPYQLAWDSTSVADGAHTLTARASDAAGNVRTSGAVSVHVVNDATAPTASITSPANGATVGGNVPVSVNAADNVGVEHVNLLVDGGVVGSDATAPYQILWNTMASGDGPHTLVARAVDAAGNEGESAPVNVTADNTCSGDSEAPAVALTAPAAGPISGTVTVSADASDDVGVTQVLFFADAALIGSAASAPYAIDWDTTTVSDGAVSLTARASDACANETTSAAVGVTVDNDPMSVVLIAPANAAPLAGLPAAITVSFDEPVDTTTVDATSFLLVRSGGDAIFDNGNDVSIVAPVSASGAGASMDLSAVAHVPDHYRVRLNDTITDVAGNALDGDSNGTPGGDYTATFVIPTYTNDTQPIYFEKCNPCHTGLGDGGHNIGINYADAFLPTSVFQECTGPGLLIGQCTIVLIQEGVMPFGAGCSGDPAQDAGNPDCLTQAQQDTIQAWINAGMPE